jgi:hypothetical protein
MDDMVYQVAVARASDIHSGTISKSYVESAI